ncbi:uncharacterized protein Dana_GF10976 [Drosophila ananassae]|uniref:Uncharacterized protein n=1 Tax=Drosophila ananassae TaxID=7217 RepID=B3MB46_DROAN|nr:uncharacterized protein LOC6493842 [Drosophila ananassae]EDV41347.1 uncharacterized protein Dana_GF10976 [Drosophila ananassae]
MAVIIPPEDAHWSLRFVDILKPFPNQTVANATYKVIRFLYPPFAQEALSITHEVSNPELSNAFMGLLLVFALLCTSAGLVVFMRLKKPKPAAKVPSERLQELEHRIKTKYGSQYKLGIWERRDIPDPIPAKKRALGLEPDSNEKPPPKSINDYVEAHWMPASVTNLGGDGRPRSPSKGGVKFNKEVKCRVFEENIAIQLGGENPLNLIRPIQESEPEDSSEDQQGSEEVATRIAP